METLADAFELTNVAVTPGQVIARPGAALSPDTLPTHGQKTS
jgi:hypothetical protein